MPDPEAVRRLLEGVIDPAEIEGDPALYSMAERIYGGEALEEMGVIAPQIGIAVEKDDFGSMTSDLSLPDFVPQLSGLKFAKGVGKGRRRLFTLLIGLLGTIGTLINNIIGGGYILCSVGIADYPYVCRPDNGNYKLVIEQGYTWERLHTQVAWTQPMDYGIVDAAMLVFFLVLVIIGLFLRKKSIHPGNIAPLES